MSDHNEKLLHLAALLMGSKENAGFSSDSFPPPQAKDLGKVRILISEA
jgi:hypothetical protein